MAVTKGSVPKTEGTIRTSSGRADDFCSVLCVRFIAVTKGCVPKTFCNSIIKLLRYYDFIKLLRKEVSKRPFYWYYKVITELLPYYGIIKTETKIRYNISRVL